MDKPEQLRHLGAFKGNWRHSVANPAKPMVCWVPTHLRVIQGIQRDLGIEADGIASSALGAVLARMIRERNER